MADYKIVLATSTDQLELAVKATMHIGFKPIGGVGVFSGVPDDPPGATRLRLMFAQAMLRTMEDET